MISAYPRELPRLVNQDNQERVVARKLMLEIKVQCDCGQRYKFDVEPVDGRMPFVVNCPICGLSGTEKANEILQGLSRQNAPALSLAAAPAFAGVATATTPALTQTQ